MNVETEASGGEREDAEKCVICLATFQKQKLGCLNCSHVFCLDCILKWSQTQNTCPVDRIKFTIVNQRRSPGGEIIRKIAVRAVTQNDQDEIPIVVFCERCRRSNLMQRMLGCSRCGRWFHRNCVNPPLRRIPEGSWMCSLCSHIPVFPETSTFEQLIRMRGIFSFRSGTITPGSLFQTLTMSETRHGFFPLQQRRARVQSVPEQRPRPVTFLRSRALRPLAETQERGNSADLGSSSSSRNVQLRRSRRRASRRNH